jgi:predicted helicase
MNLHIGYASAVPWPVKRDEKTGSSKMGNARLAPRVILRADKRNGRIQIDSETLLSGIPSKAWDYSLGKRSALDWVLAQYKERAVKDPTVQAKFNNYRFIEHKEEVIDLIARVARVSVETVQMLAEAGFEGRTCTQEH